MAEAALSIPDHPEAVTPGWLTECLRGSGVLPRGQVKAARIERFAEGVGLLGDLVRMHLTYTTALPDAPETLVMKFPSRSEQNVALCEAIKLYWREHHFYAHSSRETPLHVPRLYHSAIDGLRRFVLVLEDVRYGVAGDQLSGATADQVRIATRHVARHHARFWGKANVGAQAWLPALSDPSIVPVVQELTRAGTAPLLAQLSECFTEQTRRMVRLLPEVMPELTRLICSDTTTFVHGDYRVDNMLFGTNASGPELTVVDWQICYEACGPYDVAYLMTQSVPPDTRRAIESDVLRQYHDGLLACGVQDYAFEQCLEDYRRATTYCVCYPLIAAGTLDLANERGRALGKMMLDRALSAAQDVQSLALLESL